MSNTSMPSPTRRFLPMLLVALLLALIGWTSMPAFSQDDAAITRTPWQMHPGGDVFPIKLISSSDPAGFALMKIPAVNDSGWTEPPTDQDGNIAIDLKSSQGIQSAGCPDNKPNAVDFTYFQTQVKIPKGATVTKFEVTFSHIDDLARIFIFNSKFLNGQSLQKDARGDNVTTVDLSSLVVVGETNRVVIVQFDACPNANRIKNIQITVNNTVAPVAPPYRGLTGDVHVHTPDGLIYDFQATGHFLVVQSSEKDVKNVIVQTRLESWDKNAGRSINTAAAFQVGGDKVEFYLKPQPSFYVNGTLTTLPATPTTLAQKGRIVPSGDASRRQFIINWPDASFTARLIIYANSHMDIGVARLKGAQSYEGLLGNLDGNLQNDLQIRNGDQLKSPGNIADLNRFGDSWRIPTAGTSMFTSVTGANNPTATSLHTSVVLDAAQEANAKQTCQENGISDPIALRNCSYDVAVTGNAIFVKSAKTFEESIKALPPNACFAAVQGKIAWNYDGSKWDNPNIQRLCKGAESSLQPANCFQRVMYGGVNYGGGATQWYPSNALDLCESTLDAASTIQCFESAISKGSRWQDAIANCDK